MVAPDPGQVPRVGEHGFTMIELLIGMACAAIVVAALATIMQVALDQSTRLSDVTSSDQIGRTAMNQIVEELHSSCTGFEATAVQVPSGTVTAPLSKLNATNLWFLSAYGTGTGAEGAFYKKMYEHDIMWEKTGEVSGQKLGRSHRLPLHQHRRTAPGHLAISRARNQKRHQNVARGKRRVPQRQKSLYLYQSVAEGSVVEYEALLQRSRNPESRR